MILVQNFVCISQFCNWNLLVYIVETEVKTYFLQTTNVGDNNLGIEQAKKVAKLYPADSMAIFVSFESSTLGACILTFDNLSPCTSIDTIWH